LNQNVKVMNNDCNYFFEKFYFGLLFSMVCFIVWFLFKRKLKKPIYKKHETSNDFLKWYFNYKFFLIIPFSFLLFILALISSMISIFQYYLCK